MFSLNKKSSLLILGAGTVAVLFSFPFITRAGLFDLNIGDILVLTFRFIGIILNTIAGFLLSLAGSLIDVMLNLNRLILDPTNELVRVGWAITRDIANLGFVLVIIIIAFATIIRYQQYGSQKLLIRLIAAAILVNFSFAIVGVILNFTDVISNFFLQERLGYVEGGSLSATIATAFDPQKLLIESDVPSPPSPQEGGGFFTISSSAIISLVAIIFSIIFTLLTALVFFALAYMLLVRFVRLSILIILAPIAWLLWIMPATSQHFKSWWSDFFKWAFFLPVVSFFIYLSLLSAKTLAEGEAAMVRGAFTDSLQGIMVVGTQMVIVGALLMGGIIAANKMGIAGAGAAINIAQGARKATQKWATKQVGKAGTGVGQAGAGVGRALGRRALTAGTKTENGETTSFAERAAGGLARIPGVGRAFRGTAERIGKAKAGLADTVKERRKKYENLTSADRTNRADRMSRIANPIDAAAITAELAEHGEMNKISPKSRSRLFKSVRDTGTSKDVLSSRPDYAPQLDSTISETVNGIRADKAAEIDKSALENPEVFTSLSHPQLKRISSHGSPEQKEALEKAWREGEKTVKELSPEDHKKFRANRKFIQANPNLQA